MRNNIVRWGSLLLLLFLPLSLPAQSWEGYLEYLFEDNGESSAVTFQEAYDYLSELSSNPLDINTVETEDLTPIPGLNINQISDIIEFRQKYGRIRDIHELSLIPSIDDRLRDYLYCFLYVADSTPQKWYSKEALKKGLKHLNHRILLTGSFPTYPQDDTYLGDNTRHSIRYTVGMGEHIKFNITGGKGIGEPFFNRCNNLGYDSYTYNLSIRRLGIFKQLILGTFKGQFGMGLTMNNTFTVSKQNMLSAIGKISSTFSPYSGTSDEKHFQGAALTLQCSDNIEVSAFVSYRYADATLNADNTISTIQTNGYHRTKAEIEKKNNISLFSAGSHVSYGRTTEGGVEWSIGSSFVYTGFSSVLNPVFSKDGAVKQSQFYRLYSPSGRSTYNVGLDYRLRWRDLNFAGETAFSDRNDNTPHAAKKRNGMPLATINSIAWRASGKVTLTAVQRYYAYQYQSYYGRSFGENSSVTNESGIYGGVHYEASRRLTLDLYTDYAYFPWYRYHQPSGTYSWDNCAQATIDMGRTWTLSVRYRFKTKSNDVHKTRIIANYSGEKLQLRSHIEGTLLGKDNDKKDGFIASQSVGYAFSGRWKIQGLAAYFNTDSYDSRVYVYEPGLMYNFSYPSFWDKGVHGMLMVSCKIASWITAIAKVSHTCTFATSEKSPNNKTLIESQLQIRL